MQEVGVWKSRCHERETCRPEHFTSSFQSVFILTPSTPFPFPETQSMGVPDHYFFWGGWPRFGACGILFPQPGIEPTPPAVEAPGKSLSSSSFSGLLLCSLDYFSVVSCAGCRFYFLGCTKSVTIQLFCRIQKICSSFLFSSA